MITEDSEALNPGPAADRATELWPGSGDEALVHVGVFQSYLERAA